MHPSRSIPFALMASSHDESAVRFTFLLAFFFFFSMQATAFESTLTVGSSSSRSVRVAATSSGLVSSSRIRHAAPPMFSCSSCGSTWSIPRFWPANDGDGRNCFFLRGDGESVFSENGRLSGEVVALSTLRLKAAGDRHALAGFSPRIRRPSLTGEVCDTVYMLPCSSPLNVVKKEKKYLSCVWDVLWQTGVGRRDKRWKRRVPV